MEEERPIDRAVRWAKELGMNKTALGAALDLPSPSATITNWLKRGMPAEYHVKAAEVTKRSLAELLGLGKDEPQIKRTTVTSLTGRIAVVGAAQLGDNAHYCELEYPVGFGDGYIEWPSRDGGAFALRCKGESMKPRIKHGEFVVIEPGREVHPGDEVLVTAADGRVMVKQLAYVRDGVVYLDSVNESHPRISMAKETIRTMHYVAGIAKSAMWSQD